jgi:hypothetical protein
MAKEKDAAKETEGEKPEVADDFLIEMSKGSETLRVHPTCVPEHRRLGWQ